MEESFSIQFKGPAFDDHDIPATALAQSLLALDGLVRRTAEAVYGKDAETNVKVKAGFRPGSFNVDLIVNYFQANPVEAMAAATTIGMGVVPTVKKVCELAKRALGKKVTVVEDNSDSSDVTIENERGDVSVYNRCVINVYNDSRTRSQLSRLTQTLDQEGADSICFLANEEDATGEEFTKEHRKFLRNEEGIVLTDNESEVVLEVIGPMLNGNPKGWRFSEGEDGIEFTATVEDDEFLDNVKQRRISLVNGTAIRAVVRTVQRKTVKTRTERTIVEVKEVIAPSD